MFAAQTKHKRFKLFWKGFIEGGGQSTSCRCCSGAAHRSAGARRGEGAIRRGVGQGAASGRTGRLLLELRDVREERRTGWDERAGCRLATAVAAAGVAAAARLLRDRWERAREGNPGVRCRCQAVVAVSDRLAGSWRLAASDCVGSF